MIEINRNAEYTYRVNPDNDCVIDRRLNKHGGRWQWFARRATPADAKRYLLELNKTAVEAKGSK